MNRFAGTGKWSSAVLRWFTLLCMAGWLQVSFANPNNNWVPFPARWGPMGGAVDQSALNSPITHADTLAVVGRHFMKMGPDGVSGTPDDTRVRLFGINLGRDACFPPVNKAAEVARTLRSLGFNAVRLHQMDAAPTDDENVYQSILTQGPYPSLHSGAVERLRHFLTELKAQGIYVNLNLMVGYVFRPEIDGVPAVDARGTAPGYGSPVHVFFPRMVALQADYARQLISSLKLGGDAALAQVEIINESSLAAGWLHWDRTYWNQQIYGTYAEELDRQWQTWIKQTHGDMASACQSWGTCANETGRVLTPSEAEALQHAVAADWWVRLRQKLRHWWANIRAALGLPANGLPSSDTVHPKVMDTLKFVAETDRKFIEHMREIVHAATRPTLPVTGTQTDFGAPLNFYSHQKMDYVDAHFYVDHPVFPGIPWSDSDWHIHNETVSGRDIDELLSLAAFRDHTKPFVVSEFNQPFPNTHGHDILPVTAAFAAQQDWDGLYFFAYGGVDEDHNAPAHFFLQGDWAKASVVGMAAKMFRTGAVPPLSSSFTIATTSIDWWYRAALERRPDTWHRHLAQHQLFSFDQALTHAVSMGEAPSKVGESVSVEPALRHLADERRALIEADTVNGLFGELATHTPTGAGKLTVTVDSTEPRERTGVMVQSLDEKPVSSSRHLLVAVPRPLTGSLVTNAQARPQRRIPYRSEAGKWTLEPLAGGDSEPSASRASRGPVWIQSQTVKLQLSTQHARGTVYPLTHQGQRMQPLGDNAVFIGPNGLEMKLNPSVAPTALWYEIVFD